MRRASLSAGWFVLGVAVLGVAILSSSPLDADAGNRSHLRSGAELETILNRMRGGPIDIRKGVHPMKGISSRTAADAVGRYAGWKEQPRNSYRVVVTDREFMGGLLVNRPCWLLEYGEIIFGKAQDKDIKASVCAVVDAETGVLWEAFTPPTGFWWRDVVLRNDAVVRRFSAWGEEARPADRAPTVTLAGVISKLIDSPPNKYLLASKQVIARYFRYTSGNTGMEVRRITGVEIVPDLKNLRIWYLSFEGIDMPSDSRGRMPGRPKRVERVQEANIQFSSEDGEMLSIDYYR